MAKSYYIELLMKYMLYLRVRGPKKGHFGEIGHFGAGWKWPKSNTGTDFSASNHQGGPQQWSTLS